MRIRSTTQRIESLRLTWYQIKITTNYKTYKNETNKKENKIH